MRTKRAALTAVALTAAAVILAGCSGGGSTDSSKSTNFSTKVSGTLNAWGFNSPDEVGKARLAYAKKQLGGVKIKMDETAFDAQKFTTRVASGNVPDVVQMDANLVATYAAQGLIEPLDKCFSAHKIDPSSYFYQSVNDDVTYKGKIYAVPQFYQPPAILLNKKVLDAAGVTPSQINTSKPDELIAAAKKMYKESGGNPTVLGFNPVASGQPGLWILGYGGQLTDENGKPTLDNPKNEKGLEVLKQITDAQGGYAKIKSFSDSFDMFGADNEFTKGQVGAEVDNQWYVNVLTPYADKIDLAAVPFYASDGKPFTVANGTSFVIPTAAKNKDAACAWATSLVSEGAWDAAGQARAKTIAGTPGGINTGLFTGSPSIDKKLRSQYVKPSGNAGFDQAISTYYDIVGDGKSFGASPAGQQINTELQNVISSVLLGKATPADALKKAQASALRAYQQATK
ncbi:extracellular solute-binding protein [Gryllotalpicola daejeonensis]|uniref:Extracellular solute-binding protein n=1 Tax=Gryllotalpicola daejeonensis TaxID=993087 RepID=A0ABP7ZNV9_9MICO